MKFLYHFLCYTRSQVVLKDHIENSMLATKNLLCLGQSNWNKLDSSVSTSTHTLTYKKREMKHPN